MECGRFDTLGPAVGTAVRLAIITALLFLNGRCTSARAEPSPVRAFVVWTSPSRVYLAAGDSTATTNALAPGARLTFVDGKHTIGTGEVTGIVDGELVVATLSSGSFGRVKHLDRVRVLAERPPLPHLSVMRIGLPCRASLLFGPPWKSHAAARVMTTAGRPWPDTLEMRAFEEVTDEEIAFERGELDLAIFWPGEMSTHMREGPHSPAAAFTWGTRGVLAALLPAGNEAGLSASDSTSLASLNQDLFRGDLAPLPVQRAAAQGPASGSTAPLPAPGGGGPPFIVDPGCPGHLEISRVLNRGRPPARAGADEAGGVRIVYCDVAPDSLAAAGTRLLASAAAPAGTRLIPLFVVRCPMVCAPDLRPLVAVLGPGALLAEMGCGSIR